jgi:hypothetical protein
VPSVLYGAGAYSRTNGNFPELELVNMFLETGVQTSEAQTALLSRGGLGEVDTIGTGPIQGLFVHDYGNRNAFILANGTLHSNDNAFSGAATSIGAIAGSGPPSFAGGGLEVLVTRGTTMRSYNYTNIADVAFPDTANVYAVTRPRAASSTGPILATGGLGMRSTLPPPSVRSIRSTILRRWATTFGFSAPAPSRLGRIPATRTCRLRGLKTSSRITASWRLGRSATRRAG